MDETRGGVTYDHTTVCVPFVAVGLPVRQDNDLLSSGDLFERGAWFRHWMSLLKSVGTEYTLSGCLSGIRQRGE
jgi:hypothetical protein